MFKFNALLTMIFFLATTVQAHDEPGHVEGTIPIWIVLVGTATLLSIALVHVGINTP